MKAVVIFAILCLFAGTDSAVMNCEYLTTTWDILGGIYYCDVKNSIDIRAKEAAIIESLSPAPRQVVKLFKAYNKQIHFFPRNLENIFPSLEGMAIGYSHLKEVTKEDLKPFAGLRFVSFYENDIEVVEKDLFLYNPSLEYVSFSYNKLSHIDPYVFDRLGKLSDLRLHHCECVSKSGYKGTLKPFIAELKTICKSPQFTSGETENCSAKLERELTDIKARMSALEAMTKEILDVVRNSTA